MGHLTPFPLYDLQGSPVSHCVLEPAGQRGNFKA